MSDVREREMTIREWQGRYENGHFDSKDVNVQCEAGWYDWFCTNDGLLGRLKGLAPAITRLKDSKKIDLDNMYVFFKNNCPMTGETYDDFRICNINNGDVIYTVQKNSPYDDLLWNVYGKENNFKGPLFSAKNVYKLAAWFNEIP